MIWHGALSVFRFELRRTLTVSRVTVWLLLALFPVFIVSVMKYYEEDNTQSSGDYPRQFEKPIDPLTMLEGEKPPRSSDLVKFGSMPQEQLRKLAGESAAEDLKRALDAVERAGAGDGKTDTPPPPPGYPVEVWGAVFFGLIPEVITLFGLLLWVTPLVHSELEGRTWIYLAVRPRGRVSVLLGKYLSAVAWTAAAGWLSTTICVAVARPPEALRLWATIVGLVAFSSIAYAALYSLIGVWLHRRAMVIAVAYTLIFELLVSLIPAVINKLTVQYRLRNLLFDWMQWRELIHREAQGVEVLLGDEPTWLHVLVLLGIVVGVLAIAAQVIQRKEYVSAVEA